MSEVTKLYKEPSIVDLAYIAGIIDGEGCICIVKPKHNNYSLQICVKMLDPEAVFLINSFFPGNVYYGKQGDYQWSITSQKAYKFLLVITPYLRIKHAQSYIGIKFYEDCFLAKDEMQARVSEENLVLRHKYYECLQQLKKIHTPTVLSNEGFDKIPDKTFNSFRFLNDSDANV